MLFISRFIKKDQPYVIQIDSQATNSSHHFRFYFDS